MAATPKLPTGITRTITGGNPTEFYTGKYEKDGFTGDIRINSATGERVVFGKDNKQAFKIGPDNEISEFDATVYKNSVAQSVLNVKDSSGNSKPITDAQVKENIAKLSLSANEITSQVIAYRKGTETNYTPPTGVPGSSDTVKVSPSKFKGENPLAEFAGAASGAFGFLSGLLTDLGEFKISDDFTSANMGDLFPSDQTIQYPMGAIYRPKNGQTPGQDYLEIVQYEYKAPYAEVFTKKDLFNFKIAKEGVPRGSALKKPFSTLLLPIPNNVVDSNSVGWGDGGADFGALSAAAANYAMTNPAGLATILASIEAGTAATNLGLGKFSGFLDNAQAKTALKRIALNIQSGALINPDTQAIIGSMLLELAGYSIPPETILSRGAGVVSNSNMELLFSRPVLRNFQFQYRLTPRDEKEATEIRRIIRYFKQGMAAKKANAKNGPGGPSYFLATPNVFKLAYKTGTEEIPGLHKFKICALVGCSVNYTPDQVWMSYEKGQPASYVMALTFNEIEPIYESDYQEYTKPQQSSQTATTSPTGTNKNPDNPSVKPGDVGY
jgi:hypothetical protein